MPPFLPFLWTGIVLAVVGWGGLAALLFTTLPTLGPRWLFFFLLTLGVTGVILPLAHYLNRRFLSQPPATAGVILRQALWVGIYADIAAWLQMGRVFTLILGFFIALGFVIIEFLLRLRERSQWKPKEL